MQLLTLCKDGYLTLTVIPGTRNRKLLHLSKQGRELVNKTTRLLAQAEEMLVLKALAQLAVPTSISQ